MDKKKEDKLTSYKAIIKTNTDNAPVLAGYEVLNTKCNLFKASVDIIINKQDIFIGASKGLAELKDAYRDRVTTKLIPIAAAVHHYCNAHEEAEAAAYSDITYTMIRHALRDTEVPVLVKKILRKATDLIAEMPAYKITAEMIADADNDTTLYDDMIGKRERAVEIRNTALEEMNAAFDKCDFILKNDLDVLYEIVKLEHPTLYSEYKGAREIKSTGVRYEPEETPEVNPAP